MSLTRRTTSSERDASRFNQKPVSFAPSVHILVEGNEKISSVEAQPCRPHRPAPLAFRQPEGEVAKWPVRQGVTY